MELTPLHFFDEPIHVAFDKPPVREKTPPCPNRFTWRDESYVVTEMLSAWSDFTRRGKMSRNMRPAHVALASGRGSLNVGRFYFRVRTQGGRIFDLYYDRAIKDVDHTQGEWFLYREMA